MPPIIYVPVGIHGHIRCPVEAVPPVTHVKWNKDGRPLRTDKVRGPGYYMCSSLYFLAGIEPYVLMYFVYMERVETTMGGLCAEGGGCFR